MGWGSTGPRVSGVQDVRSRVFGFGDLGFQHFGFDCLGLRGVRRRFLCWVRTYWRSS